MRRAYDHLDPDERWDTLGDYDMPYSQDPAHYLALCKSCHVTMDKKASRGSSRSHRSPL